MRLNVIELRGSRSRSFQQGEAINSRHNSVCGFGYTFLQQLHCIRCHSNLLKQHIVENKNVGKDDPLILAEYFSCIKPANFENHNSKFAAAYAGRATILDNGILNHYRFRKCITQRVQLYTNIHKNLKRKLRWELEFTAVFTNELDVTETH